MFKDVEEILLTSKFMKQKGYWIHKLSPGTDIKKTGLPVKSKRKGETKNRIGIEKLEIPISDDLFKRLMKLAKKSDLSLYIILLTALKILIYYYTNNKDVFVVSPVYQKNISAETLNDCLIIRDRIDDQQSFIQLLLKVRESVLEAYENQDYPVDKLIEFLFNTPQEHGTNLISDIVCLLVNIHNNLVEDVRDRLIFLFEREADRLNGHILYDKTVYERRYIQLVATHFLGVLENSITDIKIRLSDISFSSKEEEKHLLFDLNRTEQKYPKEKTLVELFEEQVETRPDHIALIGKIDAFGELSTHELHELHELHEEGTRGLAPLSDLMSISYQELNEESNRLAHLLRAKGVKTGTIVGLMVQRSIEMVIGVLAILKAGGAFLPIDDEYPAARKQFILEDSDTRVLLTQKHILNPDKKEMHHLVNEIEEISVDDENSYDDDSTNPRVTHSPMDLAYIIYTSGTSGKPKGVMVHHQAIMNYTWWAACYYIKDETVRFPLYTSISFDLTMTSIFTPLVTANTIVIYGQERKASIIEQIIAEERVGIIKLTPSHLKLIKYKEGDIPTNYIKRLIVGGEELENDVARDIEKKFHGNIEIYNEYGPTEAAVGCMIYKFDPQNNDGKSVPIGTPISNTHIYILDNHLKPVPIGVPGELCISGDGVARGYLNNPELTAEKFINYKFQVTNKKVPGKRIDSHMTHMTYMSHMSYIYKTGDLARRLPDENIEFLGRIDNQVKIRGFRIELAEIETHLLKYTGIKEAVVIASENETEDKDLCAYIVPDNELEKSALKTDLLKELPDYMVPSYFIPLEKIPLTVNGKVDRKALPAPAIESKARYVPPGNQMEEKLVEIWSKILGLDKDTISIDDNFFELGGHSLKATLMASNIHKEFNVKIALVEIFRTPTIKSLSRQIKETSREKYAPIEPMEKRDCYGLSSAQKRLYIQQQMELNNISYNMPQVVLLEKEPDKERLEQAFRKLIRRHESLRTSFEMIEGQPVQRVHHCAAFKIEYYDLRSTETRNSEDKDSHVMRSEESIIRDFVRPFDLSRAPLIRGGLIKAGEKRHILMADMHHIISDGVSMVILIKEFAALYANARLPGSRLQYKDYSQWQNRLLELGAIGKQEEYWLNRFSGKIPVLNLPTDYSAKPGGFQGNVVAFQLGRELSDKINRLALETETTLFMVLLALYNVLLSKYTNQEDILVGSPIFGRSHADLQNIIGMFVNMLAMRNYPQRNKTFAGFLKEVKENALNAYENQDYQFEQLVWELGKKTSGGYQFNVNTVFVLENAAVITEEAQAAHHSQLAIKPYELPHKISKFDLTLTAVEIENEIILDFEYSSRLFKKQTIQRMARHFKKILEVVTENPQVKISGINMLSEQEKNRLVKEIKNKDDTIHRNNRKSNRDKGKNINVEFDF